MSPAVLALAALCGALVLSMTSRINVGWVAITAAWLIGVGPAAMKPDAIMAGFPVSLFLTLIGVTLLFGIAEANGTLGQLAHRSVSLVRGSRRWVPPLVFLLATGLSSVGPGSISTVALLIPLGMVIARRVGVSPFLMSLMVANGANAGNLSPVSSIGAIANAGMAKAGLTGLEGKVWLANLLASAVVAVAALVLFGRSHAAAPAAAARDDAEQAFTVSQRTTMLVIAAWIIGVVGFKLALGLSAFAAATLLLLLRAADEGAAVRRIPLGVIMMVCGVSVLIALLEKTGGMELFTSLLARLASPGSLNGVIALVTGLISTWSSTSGVVMPTFLPTVPGLVAQVGGGDPLAVALSINIGSALVDVTPLSTLGALCVAAVDDVGEARVLFRQLMAWGFSMVVVGAVLAALLAPLVARW
ncbi:MAG: C4-dicarboxylate ABC transporter [Gemmatimonadetes bacterium]|nr:C4-dicarboxylate ABC transporter [Gemmatimonadota bacterium]